MTKPNANGGSPCMPLFMASAEAQAALKAAAAAAPAGAVPTSAEANGPDGLRIVVISLAKAVELSLRPDAARSFELVPPFESAEFVHAYLSSQEDGAEAPRPAGAAPSAGSAMRLAARLADDAGGEPDMGGGGSAGGLFPE